MGYNAVMFDLDGTLADTLADIAAAGNHAYAAVGRQPRAVADFRTLAGQGLERLIRDGLGRADEDEVARAVRAFHEYYATHRYDHTAPYPGIGALLDELKRRGICTAVMSNKPDEAAVDMMRQVFGRWDFAAVRGHRRGYAVKPDPAAAEEIAAEVGVPAERWVYVGDTDVDMLTGRAAGFFTVGVTWGFRDRTELKAAGAQRIIDQPAQLLELWDL